MAKVTFGGGVSNIQGSIAGNCFVRSKAGGGIRNKVKPNNPASAAQMRQREALTRISKQWRTLTEDQRLAWDSFAKLSRERGVCGNIIAQTGHQGFMQMNMNRFAMLEAVILTPDDVQNAVFRQNFFGADDDALVREDPPECIIPFGTGAQVGDRFDYWLSGPKSPGKNVPFKKLRMTGIETLIGADISTGHIDVAGDTFFEIFGSMDGTRGKKWTFGLRQYSKSIFGVPRMMTTIVVHT
jgi:hypothetical protein